MDVNLNKSNIKINNLVDEMNSEYILDNDLIVPDNKPDVETILQVDSDVVVLEKQVKKGIVIIYGKINYKIIYLSEEKDIKSIVNSNDFSYTLDMDNANIGMTTQVYADLTQVDFDLVNGRKIKLKCIININSKLYGSDNVEIVTNVEDENNEMQVLKKDINMANTVTRDEVEFVIKEELEIPAGKSAITDLLKVDTQVNGLEARIINSKIIFKGEIDYCFLYIGEIGENSIDFFEQRVPFSEVIELEDIDENMSCEYDCKISNSYYQLKEDMDGDTRAIELENTIKFDFSVNEEINTQAVADLYSTENKVLIEKNAYSFDQILDMGEIQETTEDSFRIDGEYPKVLKIYNVINKPYINSTKVENNVLDIQGVIDTYILYISESETNPIYSYKYEVPFKSSVNTTAAKGAECELKIEVENYDFSSNEINNEIHIKHNVTIGYKIIENKTVDIVSNAQISEENEENEEMPSMIIYYVQKGDTLWNIAKNYQINPDKLMEANEITSVDILDAGKQLIIVK